MKNSPPVPHLLQAQQAPAQPYVKVVGHPGAGSFPAPSNVRMSFDLLTLKAVPWQATQKHMLGVKCQFTCRNKTSNTFQYLQTLLINKY